MNTGVMDKTGYFDAFKYSWIHISNCLEYLFGQIPMQTCKKITFEEQKRNKSRIFQFIVWTWKL